MSHAEVQAFFEAYRDAFNRLDGDAVADLWHTPSTITSTEAEAASAKLTLWSDEEPMRFLLQDFRTGYNLLRMADGLKVLLVTAYEEELARMKTHAAE